MEHPPWPQPVYPQRDDFSYDAHEARTMLDDVGSTVSASARGALAAVAFVVFVGALGIVLGPFAAVVLAIPALGVAAIIRAASPMNTLLDDPRRRTAAFAFWGAFLGFCALITTFILLLFFSLGRNVAA